VTRRSHRGNASVSIRSAAKGALAVALIAAFSSTGCDNQSSAPQEGSGVTPKLAFPVNAGTTWIYTYVSHNGPLVAWGGTMADIRGKRTWVILSSVSSHDSVICTLQSTPRDTGRWMEYSNGVLIRDSTYIYPPDPSLFTMVVTPDSIRTTWMKTIGYSGPLATTFYRSYPPGDTLRSDIYPTTAVYVENVGLLRYAYDHATQTSYAYEHLDLVSFSPH
jgi:hypothetical protein